MVLYAPLPFSPVIYQAANLIGAPDPPPLSTKKYSPRGCKRCPTPHPHKGDRNTHKGS